MIKIIKYPRQQVQSKICPNYSLYSIVNSSQVWRNGYDGPTDTKRIIFSP
jgi:hypothetical protein